MKKRHVLAIAVFALALTAALGVYALQPAALPDSGSAPVGANEPESDALGVEIGIQEAANQACSRLLSNPQDDYWSTPKNTPITASPLVNDPDNEQQNFGGIVSGPSHGTAEVVGLDAVKYTPSTNYVGSDSFTYQHIGCLQCYQGSCAEPSDGYATVYITVTN